MRLFDVVDRFDTGPASHSESLSTFLNRAGSPFWANVRTTMEEWFARIPEKERPDLRARLRSPLNKHFNAAFWELYLHEVLIRSGFRVTMHPELPATTRRPDFLVEGGLQPFLVEARAVVASDTDDSSQQRINSLYDALDRIASPNFFLWIEVRQHGPVQPRTRGLRRRLERWLSDLDPDAATALMEASDDAGAIPRMDWADGDWSIRFRAVPKVREARGNDGARPLGIFGGGGVRSTDEAAPLRRALTDKANAYGELDLPLVVALRTDIMVREDEVAMGALYGTWQIEVASMSDGTTRTRNNRAGDGMWRGPHGWRNSRLSAVLLANKLMPWNVTGVVPTLWEHPEPRHAAPALPTWRRAEVVEGRTNFELTFSPPSMAMSALLDLPQSWPPGEPFGDDLESSAARSVESGG